MEQLKGISEASIILSGKEKDLYLEMVKNGGGLECNYDIEANKIYLERQSIELERANGIKAKIEYFLDIYFDVLTDERTRDSEDIFYIVLDDLLDISELYIQKEINKLDYHQSMDRAWQYSSNRVDFLKNAFKDKNKAIKDYLKKEDNFNKHYDLLRKNIEEEKRQKEQQCKNKIAKFKKRVLKICKNKFLSKILGGS